MTAHVRAGARWLLGLFLLAAGAAHLLVPDAFVAQVPDFLPWTRAIIIGSGLVELALGVAVLVLRDKRTTVGWLVAAWFVLIVPGNLWQAYARVDGFGLTTDTGRWVRLAFQPVLIGWALWATGAWQQTRANRRSARDG